LKGGRPVDINRVRTESSTDSPPTPSTFQEAINSKDSRLWKEAIKDHLKSLEANHKWDVVDRPEGANIVRSKWVFKIKLLPNGQVDKYNARLFARGFTQRHGIDYRETFAPVVRLESLRVLFALAAKRKLRSPSDRCYQCVLSQRNRRCLRGSTWRA
jgi:Reverse transcriptase (RNA-dependent DNA polymerase)